MAGFNLFQRFYYGKAGKADFTPEQLPTNRRALFFQMLGVRYTGVMGVNLLYVMFSLPAIVWTAIFLLAVLSAPEGQYIDFMAEGLIYQYLVLLIPCLGLSGIGATGEMYVLRNWSRDQHAYAYSDYMDAVKSNWKRGLVIGLINGVSLLAAAVCYVVYGQMSLSSPLWVIPQALSIMVCVVWWMMNALMFPMTVTYEMKFWQLIRNSAIMVIARLPWSVLLLLGTFALPVLIALYVPYGWIAMIIVFLVIGFGLVGFINASYANSCFDKYLNPNIEGAPVNMGLRDPELDEDDEEPDEPEKP